MEALRTVRATNRVHDIFTTSKNIAAVFLAIWFYNCEFYKHFDYINFMKMNCEYDSVVGVICQWRIKF